MSEKEHDKIDDILNKLCSSAIDFLNGYSEDNSESIKQAREEISKEVEKELDNNRYERGSETESLVDCMNTMIIRISNKLKGGK